ncbi:DNA mismatch repair endonuclease MutL [Thermosipho atlanticus]|uniref:DNA mismatch repair protein MutL n=1 Tax=Thermosipho atlanticus DSM 15807 TaxID=1123380 RepID=A0A1M5TQA1_9BACT|nr:DNA mismatch repair endonuclease MutL [Thermosipho atlanticus]SHH52563.1 DNA mismatch repair protein MutL [Thermosipho atlanticus DSM 15807]
MQRIKKLPPSVISKIAAGEVVAGPYSVVKELIENSIDAGATSIEVEIISGGKSYIKVKDNGSGMSKDDLLLSIEEHTTSKISNFEDIYNLQMYGFRGEALASISKVSRMVITSNNSKESNRLEIIGGKIKKIEPYPTNEKGTTVEVFDLFFNIPARRKFLKSPHVEKRLVTEFIEKFILSNPNIHFVFKADGEVIYNVLPSSLIERFNLIFPEVKEFTEISGKYTHGIISSPNYNRKNRSGQVFFVQKRYIMDKMLYYIFENGYGEALINHPYGVLFINIPPHSIDVNVHPQKLEVKFSDPNLVYSDIIRAVREGIKKFVSKQIFISEKKKKQSLKNYFEKQPSLIKEPKKDYSTIDQITTLFNVTQKNVDLKKDVLILKKRYVLFEGEDGIYIMDFHAAHERVLYENILEKLNKNIETINLIVPITIKLGKSLKELLKEKLHDFETLGFSIEILNDIIKIKAIPSFIKISDFEDIFKEILNELRIPNQNPKNMKHIIADKACKAAVKTGYDIKYNEIKTLIEEVLKRGLTTCPHGRPLFLKLSFNDLDRYFERT